MCNVLFRLCFSALFIGMLAACESVTLIQANTDFVDLMQQTEEAKRLHNRGDLDTANFDSAMEGYNLAFAEAGKKAADAANNAKTPQSKASFLNLAVRNYVKSGRVGDTNVPELAEKGIATCTSEGMQELKALPVTCGYFYIATPQVVNNEWQRKVTALKRQAIELRKQSPGELLAGAQGKQLQKAFDVFIGQLDTINLNEKKIDWANTDENLRRIFDRQQDIFLCNARRARLLLKDVRETDDDWNRASVKEQLKATESEWESKLKLRGVGFPANTCTTLQRPIVQG